jgi:hypothetical protein
MPEVVSAVYEGNGLVRLSQEPRGIRPQEHLTVLIVPIPTSKELSIEEVGLDGLRRQILDFETRYSLETSEFYTRFLRGEMGDKRDFVVWAGLHELLQRMAA